MTPTLPVAALTPAHYLEAKLWLADALERTAAWRDEKREEYPEDQRNGRAAAALRMAAHYVRGTEASAGVQRFAELIHDCNASDIDLVGARRDYGLPGSESQRVATRYFFDAFGGNPDADSHETLLDDVYRAALRDLREHAITAGSPLARRLTRDEAEPEIRRFPLDTMIHDLDDNLLGIIEGPVWPPVGALIELGDPNRDAEVRNVRLLAGGGRASIMVSVEVTRQLAH